MTTWTVTTRSRTTRTSTRLAGALLGAGLLLGGCAAGGEEPSVPGGESTQQPAAGSRVTLLETRPQPVGAATVVAYNVVEGEAGVSVATGDGPAEAATVRVGETVDVDGDTWEVVAITPGGGGDGAPGSKTGEVVLAQED